MLPGNNIEFEGRKGKMYRITLNPFPIFPRHLVISSFRHLPQAIWKRYQDMLDFVRENEDFTCFYNGPKSGASAPDHICAVALFFIVFFIMVKFTPGLLDSILYSPEELRIINHPLS